jgi:hypothetical protein
MFRYAARDRSRRTMTMRPTISARSAHRASRAALAASAFGFAMLATSAAGAPSDEAPWKVRIPAHARIGTKHVPKAEFEFSCRTGEGGAFSLTLILPPPEDIAGFPLLDFEGPDAIGETHKLAEWSLSGGKQPMRVRSAISGWRGVDGDGFLLSSSRESGHPSDLARLARELIGAEPARLRLVVKPVKASEALKVEATVAEHRAEIDKILAPCLPPAKKR